MVIGNYIIYSRAQAVSYQSRNFILMFALPFVTVLEVSVPIFFIDKQLFFSLFHQHAAEVLIVEAGSVCILLLSPEEEEAGWGRRLLLWI